MPAAALHRRSRCGAAALLLLAGTLAGCASSYVKSERFEVPALPAPLDAPLPLRLALADPRELREARPVLQIPPHTMQHRYEIGVASAAVFRQALAATAAAPVESPTDRADAVLTFGPPTVAVETPPRPGLWALRLRAEFPVTLAHADGSALEHGRLDATAALVEYVPFFTSRAPLNTELLRNAAARLLVWLRAHLPEARPVPAPDGDGTPGRHTVVLRIDAGLAAGDKHEDQLTECVAAAGPTATVLRDALFPWFDPGVLPLEPDAIAALLARPAVRTRLAALDVGRLLLYSLRDVGSDKTDRLTCSTGPYGMCIGLYRETQLQVVDAALWDVATHRPLDRRSDEVKRSGGVVGMLLPIPFFTSNESQVCAHLRDFAAAGLTPR